MKKKAKKIKRVNVICDMDDIYKIINKVQMNKKEYIFKLSDPELEPVLLNVIKDSQLKVDKKQNKKGISRYKIYLGDTLFCEEATVDDFEKEIFGE